MEVSESRQVGIPVIEVHDEVDHLTCDVLWAVSDRALGEGNEIALDLRGCPYMDSGGISVLLSLLVRVHPEGILAVIAPGPDLLRVFEIVGLTIDTSFHVLSSPDELATLS
jgi:anti-anti-sigma factor